MYDLKVINGELLIPGVGILEADVAALDGKIALIGRTGSLPQARRVIDARGKIVLPGIIDPHVHFGNRRPIAEEIAETKSAIAGGITTIGCYLRKFEGSYFDLFEEAMSIANRSSYIDIMFHFQIFTADQLQELPRYARELGVTSFKFFMYGAPNISRSVDDGFLLRAFSKLAELGYPAIACVHAENEGIVNWAMADVLSKPTEGTLAEWELTHPGIAEEEAVMRASFLAGSAKSRLYIVHLSSKEGVGRLCEIKHGNDKVFVETTSIHLSITKHHKIGLRAKRQPPHRDYDDLEALWQGVKEGTIDCFGTDNITSLKSMNQPEKGLLGARAGFPSLATHLPVLITEGYHKRGLDLMTIVHGATKRPAQIFGIYPKKGTIMVGSDADLAVVDIDSFEPVRVDRLHSWGDYSPYEGESLAGWPTLTIKGGKVVYEDGEIVEPVGSGRYLPRELKS